MIDQQAEVQTIGATLEDLEAKVKLRDHLLKLEKTYAFKTLVLEGYFKDKAVALARVAGQVRLDEKSLQVWENAQIGISAFQQHLHGIRVEGDSAELAIAEFRAEVGEEL